MNAQTGGQEPREAPGGQGKDLPGASGLKSPPALAGIPDDPGGPAGPAAGDPGPDQDGGFMLSQNEQNALEEAAGMIGIPAAWLFNVVSFETAKKDDRGRVVVTWDPKIKNDLTGAAGLIQFMPDTARALGYKDQIDLVNKHPTIESQLLGPVVRYFKQFGKFPTEQSFYLSVFYPAYRFKDPGTAFPPNVQKYNPGVVTVGDYVRKIKNIAKNISPYTAAAGSIVGVLLIGVFGYLIKRIAGGV